MLTSTGTLAAVGTEAVLIFVGALVLVAMASAITWLLARSGRATVQKELAALEAAAKAESQMIVAEGKAAAEAEYIARRERFDDETRSTRSELRDEEKRIAKREDQIEQKLETLHARERQTESAQRALKEREDALASKDRQLNDLIAQQRGQLMKIANLNEEQAREQLFERLDKEMELETAKVVEQKLMAARETAEKEA